VTLLNNYPDATTTGIGNAINTSGTTDFTVVYGATAAGTAVWTKVGASAAAIAAGTCQVAYTAATATVPPVTVATTTGC
jgi:hypothetical protein